MTEHGDVTPEAEQLDRAIDDATGGRRLDGVDDATVRVLRHLTVLHEAPVPVGLHDRLRHDLSARVGSRARMRGAAVRVLAAVLGGLFVFQGAPTAFASERLAEYLGFAHEPHVYFEAGIAFGAIGLVLLAGAVRPRWLEGALAIGVPVALVFGVFGVVELPHSPNPAAEVLHFVQGAVAAVLAVVWWTRRRVA